MKAKVRESVRVGPFRFALSKSGISTSMIFKGLPLRNSPHCNYIKMSQDSISVKQSLPPDQKLRQSPDDYSSSKQEILPPGALDDFELHEIDSDSVLNMVDSSSAELLQEINAKRSKVRFFPAALVVFLVMIAVVLLTRVPFWLLFVIIPIGLSINVFAYFRDEVVKNIVILYDLDEHALSVYEKVLEAFEQLQLCKGTWHIEAAGRVENIKYHAGANRLVRRNPINLSTDKIKFFKANMDFPIIPVGEQRLIFLPDRLLVLEKGIAGAVSYYELEMEVSESKTIENKGVVPSDAKVVGQTWKYVNKSGGPDKRFKDNTRLPIALYEKIEFGSDSGLNEVIQLSRTEVGDTFKEAIVELGKFIARSNSVLDVD